MSTAPLTSTLLLFVSPGGLPFVYQEADFDQAVSDLRANVADGWKLYAVDVRETDREDITAADLPATPENVRILGARS